MKPPVRSIVFSIAVFGWLSPTAWAADITGPARVIDGDTIAIGSEIVRLDGIDAPDPGQRCERNGRAYDCGQEAAWALAERLERHWITCLTREPAEDGRVPATCFITGPAIDVNSHMVRQGWALATDNRYAEEELAAQQDGYGIWAGRFTAPWDQQLGQRP